MVKSAGVEAGDVVMKLAFAELRDVGANLDDRPPSSSSGPS